MRDFQIGDRVGAKADVREQIRTYGYPPNWPAYGHVVNVRAPLIWVRDHLGGEWGLPAHCLEYID